MTQGQKESSHMNLTVLPFLFIVHKKKQTLKFVVCHIVLRCHVKSQLNTVKFAAVMAECEKVQVSACPLSSGFLIKPDLTWNQASPFSPFPVSARFCEAATV